ncbi:MAG: NADPH:quinone oxidoreductase family protein [Gammaproteobacteria bacterium]|nr:NADPH:quinone oxidoreductase family protein [Gammaproteobacteria bacterium]
MKSLLCTEIGPLDRLSIQDVPTPDPGPRQIRIDVKAAALNYPDALMVQGLYQVKPPLPFAPGSEFAGVVSAVGPEVTRCKLGDRVVALGLGGFAEEAVVDEMRVMPLPPGMDFETGAATFLTYCTSLRALKDCGHLQPGESVLVLGASGGVGIAAIEIAKAMGGRVLAAASSEAKLEACRKAGADATVDYTRQNLRDAVKDFTGGKGVDVVYDPVGGDYSEPALRSTGWRGRYLVVGFAAGTIPKIPLNLALLNERSIVGVYWGESLVRDPAGHVRNVKQLLEWFAAGKVRPMISERVPLGGAVAAMGRMLQRQVVGKVVVLPEA